MQLSRKAHQAESPFSRNSRYSIGESADLKRSRNQKKNSESFISNHPNKSFHTVSHGSEAGSYIDIKDDDKISALIQKNDRLRTEIRKIQKVLQQTQTVDDQSQNKTYGVKLPEIRGQVVEKELENAYKQISQYELQISRMKNLQKGGSYAERQLINKFRLSKAEKMVQQKQTLRNKLFVQLQRIKKTSKEVAHNLGDDRMKIMYQNRTRRLNDELKMYEKKLTEEDRKREFFQESQSKKRSHIQNLEQQLIESGMMKHELAQLRNDVIENGHRVNAKNLRSKNGIEDEDEQSHQRTPEMYQGLLSEIKLLKKVTVTNQNLVEKFQYEKDDFHEKNKKMRQQILDMEKQTDIMIREIDFLKKHVDPQKLKPKKLLSSPNGNASFNNATFSSGHTALEPFSNRSKSILEHHFEFCEIGTVSQRGEKYNDRKILRKMSAKIIGMQFSWNRMQLLGMRATYLVNGDKIRGTEMLLKNQHQRHLQKKSYELKEGDYFATIECVMNKNIIVGIIMISRGGFMAKAGMLEGPERFMDMTPKEHPVCFFSCIGKEGIELLGVEKVEPQSIDQVPKDSKDQQDEIF